MLAMRYMVNGLCAAFPTSTVDCLEGFLPLQSYSELAAMFGNDPKMMAHAKSVVQDGKKLNLRCYCVNEFPADLDSETCARNAHGKYFDAPTAAGMEAAAARTARHVRAVGGYDFIVGFSQGGLVAMSLLKDNLAGLNRDLAGTPNARIVRGIASFGARELWKRRYGIPRVTLDPPGTVRAFFCRGDGDLEFVRQHYQCYQTDDDLCEYSRYVTAMGVHTASHVFSGGHHMPLLGDTAYAKLAEHFSGALPAACAPPLLPLLPLLRCLSTACIAIGENEATLVRQAHRVVDAEGSTAARREKESTVTIW